VGRRCKAKAVVAVLEELTSLHPSPEFILAITGPSSLPMPCGAGAKPATPPARHTSSRDPHGRTALHNHSTGASGMSSSTPSCSPRLPRLNSWLIAGAGSTTHSRHSRPFRDVRPFKQLNKELQHDYDHLLP
jgi:hypothetical protein